MRFGIGRNGERANVGGSQRLAHRVRPRKDEPIDVQIMGERSLDFAQALDISELGIGVYVSHGFAPEMIGSIVELVVTLPGERSFLARGVLRHVSDGRIDHRFGVSFVDLPDRLRDRIRQYVAKHTARG